MLEKWMPLLVPTMPSFQELLPWLIRIDEERYYSNFGPLVRELEAEFSKKFLLKSENVTTVANATQGLELVLQALNLSRGARVLLPAFTFVATATAVVRTGHQPVLADVDEKTWLLTPEIAHAACKQIRIDAVMPVATFGMPQDMQAWRQFEQETGIPVIIDAAAAYGSQWLNEFGGTLVFSLHATKSLPAGEGGVVVSSDSDLIAKVRQLSNFGINLDSRSTVPIGVLAGLGTNAKMSEYHAAVGLASFKKWEDHSKKRRELHASLIHHMNLISDHSLIWQKQGAGGPLIAPTLLCTKLPSAAFCNALEDAFREKRIMTRRWYQPLLQHMEILRKRSVSLEAPISKVLEKTLIGLPFFIDMHEDELKIIYETLGSVVDKNINHFENSYSIK